MGVKKTNNGKRGGLLKGKPHNDKNGNPVGGIKAVVTDTNQVVELEGGEVIINKEASKKHWKELSKINQSAGNGVPILPPDEVLADTEEYKLGGRTHEFNPNNLPSKWMIAYAIHIRDNYPEIWELSGSLYGDEAFKNLERVYNRGYWLDSEEWFYVKWLRQCQVHKKDSTALHVIMNLKWCNKVAKGWDYMRATIEAEIKKMDLPPIKKIGKPEKMKSGGKAKQLQETKVIFPQKGELKNAQNLKLTYEKKGDNYEFFVYKPINVNVSYGKTTYSCLNESCPNKMTYSQFINYLYTELYLNDKDYNLFKEGGELAKGIKVEKEHAKTFKKLYNKEITPTEATKEVAEEHISDDEHYYTKMGFKNGGKIAEVMGEFKRGELKSSSGEKVTERSQAIAIAISESKRVKSKMELGGNTEQPKPFIAPKPTVYYQEIEKIKKDDMESDIFYNPNIFKGVDDFVLGGFNADDLAKVQIVGDTAMLSFKKLELIFQDRLSSAIENYKSEITQNIVNKNKHKGGLDDIDFDTQYYNEINNLMQNYFNTDIANCETEYLVDLIISQNAYQIWLQKIEDRVVEYRSNLRFDEKKVNEANVNPNIKKQVNEYGKHSADVIDVKEAESYTNEASLSQILETLSNIIE